MKKLNFNALMIMMLSLYTTFYYSMKVITYSLMGRLSRKHTNRIIHSWASRLLKFAKVTWHVSGQPIPKLDPNRRYILMSNHASHYDIPLTIQAFPDYCIRMIAKKELFRVPIWGKAMHRAEFISIDRENRQQAMKDLEEAKKHLSSGVTIWVAPEGTRTRTGKMGELKKGPVVLAIQTEAIIIPFAIKGSQNILPADSWNFKLNQEVEIAIGDPIDAAEYDLKQRRELVARVSQTLQELVGEKP